METIWPDDFQFRFKFECTFALPAFIDALANLAGSNPVCIVAFAPFIFMAECRQHVQRLRKGARGHRVPDTAARDRVKVMALAILEADLSDAPLRSFLNGPKPVKSKDRLYGLHSFKLVEGAVEVR